MWCLCVGLVGDLTNSVTTKPQNILTRFYLVVVPGMVQCALFMGLVDIQSTRALREHRFPPKNLGTPTLSRFSICRISM